MERKSRFVLRLAVASIGTMMLVGGAQAQSNDSTFWGGAPKSAPGSVGPPGSGGGAGASAGVEGTTAPKAGMQFEMTAAQIDQARRIAQPREMIAPAMSSTNAANAAAPAPGPATGPAQVLSGTGPQIASAVSAPLGDMSGTLRAGMQASRNDDVAPQDYGTYVNGVYQYTDRGILSTSYSDYPHSTVGHWLFSFNNGASYFYCSASLINASIVVMAGHCLHDKNTTANGGFITNAVFTPACYNCNGGGSKWAPYGEASWSGYAAVTVGWYNTNSILQGYDVGVALLNKRGGTNTQMGLYTGWLGMCTGFCLQYAWQLTQYGFPSNYYGGNYMFEGQHLEFNAHGSVPISGKDYVYGSGAKGGSSGGPHIANVGSLSDSAGGSLWPYRNIVFAVTSWGYTNATGGPKVQGASSLTGPTGQDPNDFKSRWNFVCNAQNSLHGGGYCAPY